MVKKYSIGIDIGSKKLAVSVIAAPGQPELLALEVNNSKAGVNDLFKALRKTGIKPADCWFCFEHTGHYGLLLAACLQAKNYVFSVVAGLEIKSSQGIQRGKTDAADAHQIATYAAVNRHKIKPCALPEKTLLTAKELLSYRSHLVKIRTQLKNSLQSRKLLTGLIDNEWILTDIKEQIVAYNKRIKRVEKNLEQVITQSELGANYELVQSVKCIGPLIAATFIVYTSNFTAFETSRQFSSYAGVAPFKYQSGTSIRGKTKVSNYANKRVKTLLYSAASSALTHDPELRAYYHRMRAQNKQKMSVMNRIAFKLIGRAFAVVKRQTPYVSTYAQKIA